MSYDAGMEMLGKFMAAGAEIVTRVAAFAMKAHVFNVVLLGVPVAPVIGVFAAVGLIYAWNRMRSGP